MLDDVGRSPSELIQDVMHRQTPEQMDLTHQQLNIITSATDIR